jgi:hypothetical protein
MPDTDTQVFLDGALVGFLMARLEEDEHWIEALNREAECFVGDHGDELAASVASVLPFVGVMLADSGVQKLIASRTSGGVKAPNDLRQVQADLVAKLGLVSWLGTMLYPERTDTERAMARLTLKFLAMPYYQHRDYLEAWEK